MVKPEALLKKDTGGGGTLSCVPIYTKAEFEYPDDGKGPSATNLQPDLHEQDSLLVRLAQEPPPAESLDFLDSRSIIQAR